MAFEYLPVITTIILLFIGVVSFLVRGWIKYVNENITRIWETHDNETEARAEWRQIYNDRHATLKERVAKLEGKLNGR